MAGLPCTSSDTGNTPLLRHSSLCPTWADSARWERWSTWRDHLLFAGPLSPILLAFALFVLLFALQRLDHFERSADWSVCGLQHLESVGHARSLISTFACIARNKSTVVLKTRIRERETILREKDTVMHVELISRIVMLSQHNSYLRNTINSCFTLIFIQSTSLCAYSWC